MDFVCNKFNARNTTLFKSILKWTFNLFIQNDL